MSSDAVHILLIAGLFLILSDMMTVYLLLIAGLLLILSGLGE